MVRVVPLALLLSMPVLAGCLVPGIWQDADSPYEDRIEVTDPIQSDPFTQLPFVLDESLVAVQGRDGVVTVAPRWLDAGETEMTSIGPDGSAEVHIIGKDPPGMKFIARLSAWGAGEAIFVGDAWDQETGAGRPMVGSFNVETRHWRAQDLEGGSAELLLRCMNTQGVVHQGRALFTGCIGPDSAYDYRRSVWEVDPADGQVRVVADLDVPTVGSGLAVFEDDLYVFGGVTDGIGVGGQPGKVDVIQRIDLTTGVAETLETTLPVPLQRSATATDGEHIYLFGGRPTGASILRFDPATGDVDAMKARIPGPRYDAAATWVGDRFIIAGGIGGQGSIHDALAYDPLRDEVDPSGLGRWTLPAFGDALPEGLVRTASPLSDGFIVSAPEWFSAPELYMRTEAGWTSVLKLSGLETKESIEWSWATPDDLEQCPVGCPLVVGIDRSPDGTTIEVLYHDGTPRGWTSLGDMPSDAFHIQSADLDAGRVGFLASDDESTTVYVFDLASRGFEKVGQGLGPWTSWIALEEDRVHVIGHDPHADWRSHPYYQTPWVLRSFDLATGGSLERDVMAPMRDAIGFSSTDIWDGRLVLLGKGGMTCSECPSIHVVNTETGVWNLIWSSRDVDRDAFWGALLVDGAEGVAFGAPDETPRHMHRFGLPPQTIDPEIHFDQDGGRLSVYSAGVTATGSTTAWTVDTLTRLWVEDEAASSWAGAYAPVGWDCCSRLGSVLGGSFIPPDQEGWPVDLWDGYQVGLSLQDPDGIISTKSTFILPDLEGVYAVTDGFEYPRDVESGLVRLR